MSFSFCLNKNEILLFAGFSLLYQGLDLNRNRKLIQDSQRLIRSVVQILERNAVPGAVDFKNLACSLISVNHAPKVAQIPKTNSTPHAKEENGMSAPKTAAKSARKQLQEFASRFSSSTRTVKQAVKQENKNNRRSKVVGPLAINPILYDRSDSQKSVSSIVSDPAAHGYPNTINNTTPSCALSSLDPPNLDYLCFSHDLIPCSNLHTLTSGAPLKDFEPEHLNGYLAAQQSQGPHYDSRFYSSDVIPNYISPSPSLAAYDWSSDLWAMPSNLNTQPPSVPSVLSFSEEEVTSGEELSSCDAGGEYRGILIPNVDGYGCLEGFDRFRH